MDEMLRCPNCGNPNRAGAKFCRSCGAQLNIPAPEAPTMAGMQSPVPGAAPEGFGAQSWVPEASPAQSWQPQPAPQSWAPAASSQAGGGRMSFRQVLFSFTGRIRRQTFWLSLIALYAVAFVVGIIVGGLAAFASQNDVPLLTVVALVLWLVVLIPIIWASLAIQIKRWHDRGKSGWWILINFVPFIGGLWALIELGFLKGTVGPNRFGEDPTQA